MLQMYIQLILFSSFCEQIPSSCMRVSFSKNAYLLYSCSEISKAQDRLTDLLQNSYKTHPQYRELLRMIMSTVGRGGEGDVGQRIRDEILVLQVEIELYFFFFFDFFYFLLHALFYLSVHVNEYWNCLLSFVYSSETMIARVQ